MPFTPFHLGPSILIGLLLRKHIDLPTFVVASLAVDVRTFFVFLGLLDGPLHGFLHTFAFASFLGIGLATVMYYLKPYSKQVLNSFNLDQLDDWKGYVAAGLLGVWLHVFLDSFLYSDMKPFVPWETNPLLGMVPTAVIYGLCTAFFLLGVLYYLVLSPEN